MTMGEIIQTRRMKQGLSQEGLAEQVGVSRQAVSKWEVGDAVPDTDKLVPLARALGITTDYLLGNMSDEREEPERPDSATQKRGAGWWFATHWYWLGLIPVAWGVYILIRLIIALCSLGIILLNV